MNQWLSIRGAAKLLGVSHNTVRRAIAAGVIQPIGYASHQALLTHEEVERTRPLFEARKGLWLSKRKQTAA